MPNQVLQRGAIANLGAGQAQNLVLNGVGAGYSVTIGPGPAVIGVAAPGVPVNFAVNRLTVSVSNTTPPPGPANLTLSW